MADPAIKSAHDGQCQFQHNDERCPLPGSITNTPGRGGMFLCAYHARDGNREHGYVQEVHFTRFRDPKRVAAYVEKFYRPTIDKLREQLITQNPDWVRREGESKSEYITRIRQHHTDAGLTGATKRMPGS